MKNGSQSSSVTPVLGCDQASDLFVAMASNGHLGVSEMSGSWISGHFPMPIHLYGKSEGSFAAKTLWTGRFSSKQENAMFVCINFEEETVFFF